MHEMIGIDTTWQQELPFLLEACQEGYGEAFAEMIQMAWLADNFGKPLEAQLFAMTRTEDGSTLADNPDEVDFYDVWIRLKEGDTVEWFENIEDYDEACSYLQELMQKYHLTDFDEVGG